MRIYVLVLEGVFDTGLTAVLDSLSMANNLSQASGIATAGFDITIAGVRQEVHTALGMRVPVCDIANSPTPDWVILPALNYTNAEALLPVLEREDVVDALAVLRKWHNEGAGIAAACTGTFLLAESGLLDGLAATTTWWLSSLFRQRYPNINVDSHRIVVPNNRIVTAGAALSHLDLTLSLIRNCSPELAAIVAKYMVFDTRVSQSVYAISDHIDHSNPLVERFDRWVRENLCSAISVDNAAEALGTTKRTLARHLNAALGKTPVEYIQDLRIERAVHLLRTSKHTVDYIAEQVGYADGVTLRTLLRRRIGRGVRELRAS
ncbi:GlxA family transcriptional regulator [Ewingella americana]|uniref:GlxA family transcriptional regulator n=1 Tax=Ewingella americana TaxID=41202 RepID=UPI0012AE98A0|nr:helix-turn-helix domain-containing protein [Ewingella americana]MRT04508.1 helix-turn-helix domain-containing protein [Ewingella americana]